ncbi:MAG: 3-hydroxyacyl-CoA dehydrogenase NAD-binding domain-containing protein [Thermodesulfobacteriota bacterium]|jgi:hypothetical protein
MISKRPGNLETKRHEVFKKNIPKTTTRRPDKVVGIHFSNPVPVMKGVELIQRNNERRVKKCLRDRIG